MTEELPPATHIKFCAAMKRLGCHAAGKEKDEWISCKNCHLFFHAACAGIAEKRQEFVCCLDVDARDAIISDINAIRDFFPQSTR